jgi:hypothetical protein
VALLLFPSGFVYEQNRLATLHRRGKSKHPAVGTHRERTRFLLECAFIPQPTVNDHGHGQSQAFTAAAYHDHHLAARVVGYGFPRRLDRGFREQVFQSCNRYSLPRMPDNIEGMTFAVATCPKCSERFRLVWRIGKKKLAPSVVIWLTCPAYGHSFEQIAVKLVVFDAGREQFPKSVVADGSALVKG